MAKSSPNPTGRAKRLSLSVIAASAGGIVAATGWGEAKIAKFMGAANAALSSMGISKVITGATLVGVAVLMKALSAAFPNRIGRPWNNFLAGWGLRA